MNPVHRHRSLSLLVIIALATPSALPAQSAAQLSRPPRCCTPAHDLGRIGPSASTDCSYKSTNPKARYAPSFIYQVPVVVHVIKNTAGKGNISEAMVRSQIEILNEDFRAIQGTPGSKGFDSMIQFHLATRDPNGKPTKGITYSTNDQWFLDKGKYWNTLAWDTNRYMNIYTNNAGGRGSLGYVPDLPQGGNLVGKKKDRVVVLWNSFGRNAPNKIFNMGKTSTHEVGHYFGLLEVWENKCGSASACYTTGDLICDTKPQQKAVEGCKINATSCGTPDPVHNYMSESDDACMWWFTSEQVRRMRCTIEHWRPKLATRYSLASVSLRNAGNNLKTYKATLPVLGSRFTAAVDLQSTGYRHAALFGYTAPAKLPTIRGYMVLIDLSAPPGNVLPLPFLPGPVARFSFPIPNLSALAGFKLYTQAAHFSGKADFSLSNAQDLIFGMK